MGHAVEAGGEVMEEFAEVAVVGDGFGDIEQGLRARSGGFVRGHAAAGSLMPKRITPGRIGRSNACRQRSPQEPCVCAAMYFFS